jgi:5-aminolevulinate synthase
MLKAKTQDAISQSLEKLKSDGNYRVFTDIMRERGQFPKAVYYGRYGIKHITNWCSNDYLGMAQHKVVIDAMHTALDTVGAGSGGTRNISGTSHLHVTLEAELAKLHDKTSGLLFTSGYVANQSTLSVMGMLIPNVHFISDSLNHNSMIVGIKSSRAPVTVWRHNDLSHLTQILESLGDDVQPIIALEGVYSMDGDKGPIADVCELARRHGAMVYVDEVHAVGLYGNRGAGVAEEQKCVDGVDVIQGTLGKAFGIQGGYIAGSRDFVDMIRSYANGFIFSTSISPVLCSGALASVRYVQDHPELRQQLFDVVSKTKEQLLTSGFNIIPGNTHIIPIVIGNATRCKQISDNLLDKHEIYIQPINSPTVPVGTERLRITPTPNHTDAMIYDLKRALEKEQNI